MHLRPSVWTKLPRARNLQLPDHNRTILSGSFAPRGPFLWTFKARPTQMQVENSRPQQRQSKGNKAARHSALDRFAANPPRVQRSSRGAILK
jgi:hypothetical protein